MSTEFASLTHGFWVQGVDDYAPLTTYPWGVGDSTSRKARQYARDESKKYYNGPQVVKKGTKYDKLTPANIVAIYDEGKEVPKSEARKRWPDIFTKGKE